MDENDDRKIVITPSDENTEKIGKILANETCRKILDVLSNEPLSSTQIAEKMGIPLTTVESNIDRMAEVGMIRVHHKQWSPKGRKVNFYEPAEKLILIAPKAKTKTPYKRFRNNKRWGKPTRVLMTSTLSFRQNPS